MDDAYFHQAPCGGGRQYGAECRRTSLKLKGRMTRTPCWQTSEATSVWCWKEKEKEKE